MAACERCPSPGNCAACPFLRPLTFGRVRVIENVKKIFEEKELTPTTYYFSNPARQGGAEPPKTGEVICFICIEKKSTCRHSESKTNALKAA